MLLIESQYSASRRARSPETRTSAKTPRVFPIEPTAGRWSSRKTPRKSASWVISGRAPRMPMVGTPALEMVQQPSPSNTPSQNIGCAAASSLVFMISDFRGTTPCRAKSAAIRGDETSATEPAPRLSERRGRPGEPTNSRNRWRIAARELRWTKEMAGPWTQPSAASMPIQYQVSAVSGGAKASWRTGHFRVGSRSATPFAMRPLRTVSRWNPVRAATSRMVCPSA
jgi:hypothetical protein